MPNKRAPWIKKLWDKQTKSTKKVSTGFCFSKTKKKLYAPQTKIFDVQIGGYKGPNEPDA